MYFHKRKYVFVVQKAWNQLYDFMHSLWFFFKNKCSLNILYS
jgi:hypothetical protein